MYNFKKFFHYLFDDAFRLTPQVSFNQSLTLMPSVRTALNDLLFSFIGSPSKRKVAQYNAKQYLPEYRRFYWIGERYYIQVK